MTKYITVVLFVLLIRSTDAELLCDVLCHCTKDLLTVDCSRVHLNVVPDVDKWPPNASSLDLNTNNISVVDVDMAHNNLETLNFSHNKIKKINPSVFGDLKKLKHLDLSYNQVEKLEQNTFYGLEGLISLDLSHNKFRTLPDDIFNGLYVLQDLKIGHNEIIHFTRLHLNRMFELRRLDISNIGAYSLQPDLFAGFQNVEFLDLSQNEFHTVPTEAIRGAANLRELWFNENPIEELNKKSFMGMKQLQRLEINFNGQLSTIGSNTFSPLTSLKSLEVKNNKKLNSIHPDAFQGLFDDNSEPTLKELDLQFNQLKSLTNLPCNKMDKMNLQRNPWTCDCRFKWIKSCMIQEIYAADFKCMAPYKLRNQLVVQTMETDFQCDVGRSELNYNMEEVHHNRVVRTISLALGCAVLVMLGMVIVLVLKWRSIRWWWRNRRKGPGAVYYVRANPAQEP